jgi:alpha-glucosidase
MDRDDQEMVRFYHEVAEKAARRHLTVTWHGAYKPTGMERTWPNVWTYEAALNQEYDKWDPLGASPTHNLDIALVRMLAGPLDYHQGGMRNVLPRDFQPRDKSPAVQGTRAHQLGMYVVFENHLPMLVDFPAAYRGQPGLDFLAKVPTNWDQTLVPRAELRKCIVVARRSSNEWWLGGMAGDQQQTFELPLNFIGAGRFAAQIHRDDLNGPATALQTERQIVRSSDSLKIIMAAGGGFAAHITPIDN